MTFKLSASANPATYLDITDAPLLTLPNSDWTWGAIIVTNASLPGTAEYVISNGGFNGAGWASLALNPSTGQIFAYIDTDSSTSCNLSAGIGPSQAWFIGLVRKENQLYSKACRVTLAMPTDGSAVLTSPARALAKELDSTRPTRIGARSNGTTVDRNFDQSLGRAFCIHSALTDLEIAKLAHGMQLADIGKAPVWYIKGDTGSDTADSGPNALTVTRSTGAAAFANGADPGFGYVQAASPPVFSIAPAINGTPTAGVAATYTAGTVSGTAAITSSFQFLLDDVAVGTAGSSAAYTPAAGDAGKTLKIRQTATNGQGNAQSTSVAKTIAAASSANTITITPPANESIFAHTNGSRNITMAVTYEGEAPATIEYQLYASDGVTASKAWAAVALSGGNISPSIATSLRKQRIAVRSKNAAGTVLATSTVHANRFAVGHLVYMGGSSGAQAWGNLMSGSAYDGVDGDIVGQFRSGVWGQGTVKSYATRMAMTLSAALGMAVGMVHNGVSGTSLKGTTGWSTWTSPSFTNARAAIGEVGGKVSSFMLTVGSNDAGNPGGVVSQADHLFYIRQLIQNLRDTVVDPTLPGLWVGMNRRTGTTATPEVYEAQANWVRAAENQVGDDANVFHVQTLDFEMHGDQVHLTDAGIFAQTTRMAYVMVEALAGRYRRGPKIAALSYSGADLLIDVQHRNGTDLAPATGGTGISLSDASGTPALVLTARVSTTRYRASFERALVAPVNAKYLSGGAPDPSAPIVDNGTVPLPMHAETVMATTAASEQPVQDTAAPNMTGAVTASSITSTGGVISWPMASDDTGVTGYEYSTNGGTSYINANTSRTVTLSGLASETTYQLRARAYDAAGNRSTPVSGTLTTLADPDTNVPVITGNISVSNITLSSASITWPIATDNIAVTGYEYSINGGSSYVNAGTARTASLAMLSADTIYQLRVRAYDAAGNRSTPISGSFTTASGTVDPVNFVPSASRTVRILAGQRAYDVGSFWTASGNNSPVGSKDPNSTIDIHFDWTAWLADIGNAKLSAVDFILSSGIESMAGIPTDVGGTVFISSGTISQNVTITCRITTATIPPRIEDRTVVLQIKEQ